MISEETPSLGDLNIEIGFFVFSRACSTTLSPSTTTSVTSVHVTPFSRSPAIIVSDPLAILADTFALYCSTVPSLNFTSKAEAEETVSMPPAVGFSLSSGVKEYLEMFLGKRPPGMLYLSRKVGSGVWTLPEERKEEKGNP